MNTFLGVTDHTLAENINKAKERVVLLTPAISLEIASALDALKAKQSYLPVTIILDPDEDAYRVGYGDQRGIELLKQFAQKPNVTIRSQAGLRLGLLITDDELLLWSPTPKSVEDDRQISEPNGIRLDNKITFTEQINHAIGVDVSNSVLAKAEIGKQLLSAEQVTNTIQSLTDNPPAPVDLSKMARIFSTKIQFVECTLRGAQWTERETSVSSLLLNADVPDELKDLFDTRIRPFSKHTDIQILVPATVRGQLAYDKHGQPLTEERTQSQIKQQWEDIIKRYLQRLKGFGLLIRRIDKAAFIDEVNTFEIVLKDWVKGFREIVNKEEANLANDITKLVMKRFSLRPPSHNSSLVNNPSPGEKEIESIIRKGIQGMRIIEPSVKLVFKDVAWESTRDVEFSKALREVLPQEDLEGWFKVYSAAPERATS